MNKPISLVVLLVGIVLIIYGIGEANSFSSDISRIFTNAPTDRTIALWCGGVVFAVLGGYGLSRHTN